MPDIPQNIRFVDNANSYINLACDLVVESSDTILYNWDYNDGSGWGLHVIQTTDPEAYFGSLIQMVNYQFRVRAYNLDTSTESLDSDVIEAVIYTPTSVNLSLITTSTVRVTVNDSSYTTSFPVSPFSRSYEIQVATDGAFMNVVQIQVIFSGLEIDLTALTPNTTYFIRAATYDARNNIIISEPGGYTSFTTSGGTLPPPNLSLESSSFSLVQGANTFNLIDAYQPQTTPKARVKASGVPGSSRVYYTGDGKPDSGAPYILTGTIDQKENVSFLNQLELALIGMERLVYTKVAPNLYLEIDTDLYSRGYQIYDSTDRSWIGTVSIVFNVKSPVWKRVDNDQEVGTVL